MSNKRNINKEDYPMVEDWSEYKTTSSILPCKCEDCGEVVYKSILVIDKFKRCFCKKCGKKRGDIAKRRDINREDYPMVTDWDEYKNINSKLSCKCQGCGEIVFKSISKLDFYKNCFCKKCGHKNGSLKQRKIINREDYPNVDNWDNYKNAGTRLQCKCEGCGKIIMKSISYLDRFKRCFCRKCANKTNKISKRKVVNRENYPMVVDWSNYKTTKSKLPCKCQSCCKIISVSFSDLQYKKKSFCRSCVRKKIWMSTDNRKKIEKTNIEKFGVKHPMLLPEIKNKVIKIRRKNGTLNTSKPEEQCYQHLIELYGESNVKRQWNKDSRYPFCVDFYIIPEDLFIECNFHWSHGKELYSIRKKTHKKTLSEWKIKAETSKYYQSAIDVWTSRDPLKTKTAKKNSLNYIVFYNKDNFTNYFNNIVV